MNDIAFTIELWHILAVAIGLSTIALVSMNVSRQNREFRSLRQQLDVAKKSAESKVAENQPRNHCIWCQEYVQTDLPTPEGSKLACNKCYGRQSKYFDSNGFVTYCSKCHGLIYGNAAKRVCNKCCISEAQQAKKDQQVKDRQEKKFNPEKSIGKEPLVPAKYAVTRELIAHEIRNCTSIIGATVSSFNNSLLNQYYRKRVELANSSLQRLDKLADKVQIKSALSEKETPDAPYDDKACRCCGKSGPHSIMYSGPQEGTPRYYCSNKACDAMSISITKLYAIIDERDCQCSTCHWIKTRDRYTRLNARQAWHMLSLHYRAGNDDKGYANDDGQGNMHIPMSKVIHMHELTGIIKLTKDHPYYEISLLKDFDPRKQFPCPKCGHPRPKLPVNDEHECPYCSSIVDACRYNGCPECHEETEEENYENGIFDATGSLVPSDNGAVCMNPHCKGGGRTFYPDELVNFTDEINGAYFNMPAKGVIAANAESDWDSTIFHVGHPARA